jgi:hypothetical protein
MMGTLVAGCKGMPLSRSITNNQFKEHVFGRIDSKALRDLAEWSMFFCPPFKSTKNVPLEMFPSM